VKTIYTAAVTATGGREGHIHSQDNVLDLKLAVPKSMGGPGGQATNPEQLFAAGYSACFQGAMGVVARKMGKSIDGSTVTGHVSLHTTDAGGYQISAELHVKIPNLPKADAEEIVKVAHTVCPYSLATKGNIDVKLVVE